MINKDGQKQIPEKGPVMLLYELFNDVNIECASADGAQHSRFKMIATVNERKFEGTGLLFIRLITFGHFLLIFVYILNRSFEKIGQKCSCQGGASRSM